ncbi:MAG: hypothetical protein HRT44_02905 [Bdellovibrionales bacterium]|nr:hypothetical protein [Bdellovibrionales bacterium]
MAKEWENGSESSFGTFMKEFSNIERLIRFAPLLIVSMVSGLASQLAVNAGMSFIVMAAISIVTFAIGFVIGMMVNQMIFQEGLSVQQSLDNAIKATTQNIGPLIVLWIIYFLLATVSAVLLFLPLIFAFLPAMTSFNYIVYRVLFEGLELKAETEGTSQDI